MAHTTEAGEPVVIYARMLDDGTLTLRVREDERTMQMSDAAVLRPDEVGALTESRVGKAFIQLCGIRLMSRRRRMQLA